MKLDEIREQIAQIVRYDIEIWGDTLDNTSPGNYGCDDWDAEVDSSNIFVVIQARTFTVKGNFSAKLVMGASTGDSSFVETYSKPFSGAGEFDFQSPDKVNITSIQIEIDRFIYNE